MSLSDKSDEQIEMMVARIAQPEYDWFVDNGTMGGLPWGWNKKVAMGVSCEYEEVTANYCSDDALAFRLMVDNGIHTNPCEFLGDKVTMWSCHTRIDKCVHPNRAICECFILMNGGG